MRVGSLSDVLILYYLFMELCYWVNDYTREFLYSLNLNILTIFIDKYLTECQINLYMAGDLNIELKKRKYAKPWNILIV